MTDVNKTATPNRDQKDPTEEAPIAPNDAGKGEGAPATGGDGAAGAGGPDGFGAGD